MAELARRWSLILFFRRLFLDDTTRRA